MHRRAKCIVGARSELRFLSSLRDHSHVQPSPPYKAHERARLLGKVPADAACRRRESIPSPSKVRAIGSADKKALIRRNLQMYDTRISLSLSSSPTLFAAAPIPVSLSLASSPSLDHALLLDLFVSYESRPRSLLLLSFSEPSENVHKRCVHRELLLPQSSHLYLAMTASYLNMVRHYCKNALHIELFF